MISKACCAPLEEQALEGICAEMAAGSAWGGGIFLIERSPKKKKLVHTVWGPSLEVVIIFQKQYYPTNLVLL